MQDLPELHLLDSALIIAYLVATWLIALTARKTKGKDNFLLAGRSLTIPAFVATLVTTWYGGILGVGEYGFLYGISSWLVFGIPYYIHAIIFAFVIAPRARKSSFVNLPDQVEQAYGRRAAIIAAAILFIVTVPAAYLLMLGTLLQIVFPLPLFQALVIGAILSAAYLWIGGFRAVIRTDIFQFIFMFGGFLILFIVLNRQLPLGEMFLQLPEQHLTWHGGNKTAYIALWYIVAAQTYIEPTFHQRCYAAKSPKVARNGTLISVGAWIVFDFLTTMTALYGRVLLPDLADPLATFPALAALILPVGLVGLFIAALFAIVMSTVDSYGFIAAITFGRDFIGRLRGKVDDTPIGLVKWSIVLTMIIALGLAAWRDSVIELWKDLGSIATPALLLPILSSFSEKFKMRPQAATISMLGSVTIVLLWMLSSKITLSGDYFLQIEPIYPALLFSVIVYLGDRVQKGSHQK